jgi:hypothetical protein
VFKNVQAAATLYLLPRPLNEYGLARCLWGQLPAGHRHPAIAFAP